MLIEDDLLAPSFLPLTELAAGLPHPAQPVYVDADGDAEPDGSRADAVRIWHGAGRSRRAVLQVGEHWELYS